MINQTIIRKIGKVQLPDPQHGDFKLSVFPFEHTGERLTLPEGFKIWEDAFNEIMSQVPLHKGANNHYVTIDSKFFTKADFLRREGIHADGNFCVDPNFKAATWGGASPTWGGAEPVLPTWGGAQPTWGGAKFLKLEAKPDNSHVKMDWVLPYDIMIPVGDYISSTKGGLLCLSTEVGCQGWHGEFYGHIGAEGDCTNMSDQFIDEKKVVFEKDNLYFMTSNTPHETLVIDKGKRRTFIRITLNHEYPNELLPCMKEFEKVSIEK